MARENRNPLPDLIASLANHLATADYFQIVRLAHRAVRHAGAKRLRDAPVRHRAAVGLRHPAHEVSQLGMGDDGAAELTANFMGLTGPHGVLPDFYSELLIAQRQARNPAAGDFLDLFNDRALALFYRAWARPRLPVRYEEAGTPLTDPISRGLASLVGLGLNASRSRLEADRGELLSVAAPLSRRVRTADGLQRILSGLYEIPIEVRELQGRWIPIRRDERTRLSGAYCELGSTAVLGAAVWDVQGRFRLRIGPLGLADFQVLAGDGAVRRQLVDLVRFAVGPGAAFDLQLVLKASDVPTLRLAGGPDAAPRLGRTTWLCSGPSANDRDDAILDADGAVAA